MSFLKTKQINAARSFVREHIASDELEIVEALPVARADEGVWVPMRQFVRFSEIDDYLA